MLDTCQSIIEFVDIHVFLNHVQILYVCYRTFMSVELPSTEVGQVILQLSIYSFATLCNATSYLLYSIFIISRLQPFLWIVMMCLHVCELLSGRLQYI